MMNLKLENICGKLHHYLSHYQEAEFAYLFGSTVYNKASKYSDIDIALFFSARISNKEYSDRKLCLMDDLSKIFDRNIDIIILNNANSFLKYRVLKDGIKVYESYKGVSHNFKVYSILEYFDFLFIRRSMEEALIKRIKEHKHG